MTSISLRRAVTTVMTGLLLGSGLVALEAAPRKAEPTSLRYQRSYGDAMLEARLRGVPIWFARHMDG